MTSSRAPDEEEPSYIDYETFLAPDFNPAAFANSLVLATNNPNDAPLDLSTPLSRVLFDIQEIDSHIDLLTTRSAVPLLSHTRDQTNASARILSDVDAQVRALNDSYAQLEREVLHKHAEAAEVRAVASRLWHTVVLGRSVARCLQLGRQLEVQHAEIVSPTSSSATSSATSTGMGSRRDRDRDREDHRALTRCAHTILALREITEHTAPGEEGHGIEKVHALRTLQDGLIAPTERSVRDAAERIVREFAIGAGSSSAAGATATYAQWEDTKARTISALATLYLLSPTALARNERWAPTLMLQALEVYLRTALQSSIASVSRALGQLPALERTLAEVAARCQNVVALEALLDATRPPPHPMLTDAAGSRQLSVAGAVADKGNLLQPLLGYLETGSLASYFWRTMASSLSTRVQEIVSRGGVAARTLKTNKGNLEKAIRDCVIRGCQLPSSLAAGFKAKGKQHVDGGKAAGWDREVAVMVGSVVGNLGR